MSESNESLSSYFLNTESEYFPTIIGIVLGTFIIFFYFRFYLSETDKLDILDKLERKINSINESVSFYTNKLLLNLNMQGTAVKTTQIL